MPNKVILLVIDGCRPDAVAQTDTPNLDRLAQSGAYTLSGKTVMPSITLPCHMSMFRGVNPEKHGVDSNDYNPAASAFPSIIDMAHNAGLHTCAFHSWEELRDLAAPGNLDLSYYRSFRWDEDSDLVITQKAADYIIEEQPDLSFVYFARTDLVGHIAGWMSPEYLTAVEDIDRGVGAFYERLESAGIRDQFVTLALTDHGGHDHEHGSDLPEDMTLFWLLQGPGIKVGHELKTPINISDTAVTIAHLLGLPPSTAWDGKVITEAFA